MRTSVVLTDIPPTEERTVSIDEVYCLIVCLVVWLFVCGVVCLFVCMFAVFVAFYFVVPIGFFSC